MPLNFEEAYESFIRSHVKHRKGPSAQRIENGLDHAELLFLKNVWWPAFHHFEALHPEYEIRDFKDGHRYIDFAYIQPHFRIAIEIDGMGPHWTDITPDQFCDHCQRQNHLVLDEWKILRFAYKDVHDRPRGCQRVIQQLIGRLTSDPSRNLQTLTLTDREIVRLAMGLSRPVSARDLVMRLGLGRESAFYHLKGLTKMGWLEPASGSTRIRSYRVHPLRANMRL